MAELVSFLIFEGGSLAYNCILVDSLAQLENCLPFCVPQS